MIENEVLPFYEELGLKQAAGIYRTVTDYLCSMLFPAFENATEMTVP